MRKKKKTLYKLYALVLIVTIGYAAFSVLLKTRGTFGILPTNVSVIWQNPVLSEDSVAGDVTIDNETHTIASFSADLNQPGEFHEFTIEAYNNGDEDAMIDSIDFDFYLVEEGEEDEEIELPDYLNYSFTYIDGSEVEDKHLLEKNTSTTYKVRLEVDKDLEEEDLPIDSSTIRTELSINFKIDDGTAISKTGKYANIAMLKKGAVVNNMIGGMVLEQMPDADEGMRDGYCDLFENDDPGKCYEYDEYNPYHKQVTSIERATTEEYNAVKDTLTDDNLISLSTNRSKYQKHNFATNGAVEVDEYNSVPVYMWYDNGTIYYYTTASKIYLNEDSSYLFGGRMKHTSINLSDFNTKYVKNMEGLFYNNYEVTDLDFSNFDTSNVENMAYLFKNCRNVRYLDLSHFNTSKVTDMAGMFYESHTHYIDLSSFDTSNVTNMDAMFDRVYTPTLDVSSFNTKNVRNMDYMFSETDTKVIYASSLFDTSNVSSSYKMFEGCSAVGGNGTENNGGIDKEYAKIDKPGSPGYFTLKDKWVLVNRTWGSPSDYLLSQRWSYFENGNKIESGFRTLNDLYGEQRKYFFLDGVAQIGWLNYNGNYYYLSEEDDDGNGYVNCGAFMSETKTIGNKSYTFNSDGVCTNYSGTAFNSIFLNTNGGYSFPNIKNITTSNIGTLPTPTKMGYTFDGWYTEIDGGIKVTSSYVPTNNQVLYARWILYYDDSGVFHEESGD